MQHMVALWHTFLGWRELRFLAVGQGCCFQMGVQRALFNLQGSILCRLQPSQCTSETPWLSHCLSVCFVLLFGWRDQD